MLIKFQSPVVQNAIYTIACEKEGFKTDNIQDEESDKNMMQYFYGEIHKQGECGFGLEEAIRDYLLMDGEFEIGKGKYGWIADGMQCEVYDVVRYDE